MTTYERQVLATSASMWYRAVQLQARRGRVLSAETDLIDQQSDALMFVLALAMFERQATLLLTGGNRAVQRYRAEMAAAVKEIRDILNHFEAYLVEDGFLQRGGEKISTDVAFVHDGSTPTVFVGGRSISVAVAAQAAERLHGVLIAEVLLA